MKNRRSRCSRHGNLWLWRHLEEWGRTMDWGTDLSRYFYPLSPLGGGGLWNLCAAEGTADPGNQNDNDDKGSCYLLIDLLPAVCLLPTWLQSTRMGPSNKLLLILRTPSQWGRNLDPSVTSEMEKSRALNSLKTLSCLGRPFPVQVAVGGGLA